MAYKGTRKAVPEIGQELGADYLVEGSIRAEGARLFVTSRLVRVRDQTQVSSASYDREPTSCDRAAARAQHRDRRAAAAAPAAGAPGRAGTAAHPQCAFRGHLLAKLGRTTEAREILRTLDGLPRERYVPPYAFALVHSGLGERDAALAALKRAYEARGVHLVFLPVDPKWDASRDHPRFRALVARCGFAARAP